MKAHTYFFPTSFLQKLGPKSVDFFQPHYSFSNTEDFSLENTEEKTRNKAAIVWYDT